MESDAIKEHWEEFHKTGHRGALSGSSFAAVSGLFGLAPYIEKGKNILNIGVGLGYCTKHYFDVGCNVSALDISEEALARVSQWTTSGFLHKDCDKLPSNTFDVAISHLVTQHMSEEDILFQFTNVIRSLKDDGVLFVQFAGSDVAEENNISETIVGNLDDGEKGAVSMLGGRMVRTPEYASELLVKCGGDIDEVSPLRKFPRYKSYWFYLKVRRANA